MKKLYLLADEWDRDRNFVGEELKLICEKYDVTVICNSASTGMEPKARYLVYSRPSLPYAFISLIKGLADRDLWREMGAAAVYRSDVNATLFGRISEVIRFYINADLFRRYMKKQNCFENDAVYYSYWNFWKCYAVTRDIHKYQGSRVISRIHGYDLYDVRMPSGYQPFKNSMDMKLDRLIFISEMGKEYYLHRHGKKDSDKYGLYLLGTERGVEEKRVRDHYGDHNDGLLIVSCSRIDDVKRVERIVEALSYITDFRILWVHFGAGNLEQKVKDTAARILDDKDNIRYEFKGQVENHEIHDFYKKNMPDLFITASSSEGNPVSVMEAMSYGIPVVAPAICNFPKMINGCGILVDAKCEASDLANAIRRVKGMSPVELGQLRDNAYRCWDRSFNADKNNQRFIKEVLDVL